MIVHYAAEERLPANFADAIDRYNLAAQALVTMRVPSPQAAEDIRVVLAQVAGHVDIAQAAVDRMLREIAAATYNMSAAVADFLPPPIGSCTRCGRLLYESPAPIDKTATLCDMCYGDLVERIETAPDLARAIVAALRLNGGKK
jgi:hypothetical protein